MNTLKILASLNFIKRLVVVANLQQRAHFSVIRSFDELFRKYQGNL